MFYGVRLRNFRSYKDQTFEFEDGVNIVIGPNASGKTNLLEALYVLAQGSSFRAKDADLVRFGAGWARLDGDMKQHQRSVKLAQKTSSLFMKGFVIKDKPLKRLTPKELLPVVLFVPDDLRLLTGSPRRRRRYLDTLAAALAPERKTIVSRYNRALKQRNRLLKSGRINKDELFAWSIKLTQLGANINRWRQDIVSSLNQIVSQIYGQIAGVNTRVKLVYNNSVGGKNYAQSLGRHLSSDKDIENFITTAGPHREDFSVVINRRRIELAASRGEVRTLVLALKIAEMRLIESAHHARPLLLFDDVFSELDGSRRRLLAEALNNHQTLITSTDADAVIEHFGSKNIIALPSIHKASS